MEYAKMEVRMKIISMMGTCLFMVCLTLVKGNGQTQLPGQPREGDERLVAPLVNAGISLDQESLIQALQNDKSIVASRAALALSRFPKHQKIVEALNLASQDKREFVATSAIRSLMAFNENNWVPNAISRLPIMEDRVARIQLAGLLARVGHAEGWPIVISAVSDEKMAGVALENVTYFDKLNDQSGMSIDVVTELNRLLTTGSELIRKQIERKLMQLKNR
jgi:hypothetical protein